MNITCDDFASHRSEYALMAAPACDSISSSAIAAYPEGGTGGKCNGEYALEKYCDARTYCTPYCASPPSIGAPQSSSPASAHAVSGSAAEFGIFCVGFWISSHHRTRKFFCGTHGRFGAAAYGE